jgi:hypothetical protein
MRTGLSLAAICIAAVALAGCKPAPAADLGGSSQRGRYAGIGIYSPETPWTRMVATQQAKETPAAKPIDDQAIIVVQDTVTGEVRACGDLTGYCIGMNPWKTPLASSQVAPINLTEHVKPPEPVDVKAVVITARPKRTAGPPASAAAASSAPPASQ